MEKPSRGHHSPPSGSQPYRRSDSGSSSHRPSRGCHSPPSGSQPYRRLDSGSSSHRRTLSSSSSLLRSISSRSPTEVSTRGHSPPPQSKEICLSPRKAESCTIRIYNLPDNVTEGDIRNEFSVHGQIVHVMLLMYYNQRISKGHVDVEFQNATDARIAKLWMDGNNFGGNRIKVDLIPLPLKTLPPRPKVSQALKAISNASKRDAADGGKDELKRKREASPHRNPPASPRRRSPVAQRGGSSGRLPNSSLHRRIASPYRRGDTSSSRGSSPLRRNRPSPPCKAFERKKH